MFLKQLFQTILFIGAFFSTVKSQSVETIVQTGHYSTVTAVCYSVDGKFIATGSDDKAIKLWRVADGKEMRVFLGNRDGIRYLEFNKQGTSILSVADDGEIILWDAVTGNLTRQFNLADDRYTCAAFHPNGLQIVAGSKKSHIRVLNISDGTLVQQIKANLEDLDYFKDFDYAETKSIGYSADGKFIIAGASDRTAILWDAITYKEVGKYKNSRNICTSCVSEAKLTHNNKYVVLAQTDTTKIFDRQTGELVCKLKDQKGSLESIVISTDDKLIAGIEYGLAKIWELKTGKLLSEFGDNSEKRVKSLSISPDCKYIVTGNEMRTADIWEIATGKKLITLQGYLNQVDERLLNNSSMSWATLISEAKLSPDGRYIAVGRTGNNAKLIDFKTGRVQTLAGHSSMVVSINFSNDGKYLVTGGMDGKAILWNSETGKFVKKYSYRDSSLAIFSVDISNDNRMLATADWAGYIVIWDIETGKILKSLYPHGGSACYHVKFAPNGIYVISAGLDRKLKLLEIDTGEEIRVFTGHTELVNSININPAGDKIITSAWDGTYRVWDFLSGLQVNKVRAHLGGVYCAKFDATGKYIISGGDDNKVKLWDAASGVLISEFAGHRGGVGDVNITPDRKFIISGSRDGSVRIWNVEEKREMLSMVFMNENDWFLKNAEGYFDATEGAFGSISFVKGIDLFSLEQFFTEFYKPGLYREVFGTDKTSFRQNIQQTIESYPPPLVEILSPEINASVDKANVTCIVKVTNKGGGIKELKVMHNGKRQLVDEADLNRMKKEGQYTMKTFDLNLVPGENELTVSALSDGDIESELASTSLIYKGLQKTANCYVLSIGINKYENENLNLTYAQPDAKAFSDVMGSKAKKIFNKIYSYSLFDKEATKEKILATFDEIRKTMKKEDVFVFFFAGHGSIVDKNFYFITTENTGLYQQDKLKNALQVKELQDKLKELPALKQVVFIDACHSGSSVDLLAMRGANEEKALAQLSRSSGIHVMASSESQQQSAEIKSLGHGVFTYVLLEALKGNADGAPKDAKITVYEIKSYLDDQVPELSFKLIQHKQFPSTFSIGHDFPLVVE